MSKPLVKIPVTKVDWVLEIAGFLFIAGLIFLAATAYGSLPDTIPIHFNASGKVDGYGKKLVFWVIPFTTTVAYAALSIAQHYPHKFNYLFEITEENAQRQYRNALYMVRAVKLMVAMIFLYLTYATIQNAMGNMSGVSSWFLRATVIALLGTIAVFFVRGYRLK